MSVRSRRSVEEKLKSVSPTYANRFQGLMTYERIGLLEFEVLNNLTDTTFVVPYDVVLLYLPMIFADVIPTEKVKRLLSEDRSLLVVDFVEGEIYRHNIKDKLHLDIVAMAIDDKKNSDNITQDSLENKVGQVLTGDLDILYKKNQVSIHEYLKDAERVREEPDPLITREEPTITSVIRSKMDKSTDAMNGLT